MSDAKRDADASDDDRLEAIIDEFAALHHGPAAVDLAAFLAKYPEHEHELRELLPPIVAIEKWKHDQLVAGARIVLGAGSRLGDYLIHGEIGRGGMGVVYEAEQVSLGRMVALKVLTESGAMPASHVARFKQEARTVSRLRHPAIVPVFGVGSEGGMHWFAMSRIQGVGLDKLMRGLSATGQPPVAPLDPLLAQAARWMNVEDRSRRGFWSRIAEVGAQLADALDHAHRNGVLHRDVKPGNILIEGDGTSWITDFGVAKLRDEPGLTKSGDLLGTLHYAPPEQFDGFVDARSDVYGLGLSLFELAIGDSAWADTSGPALIEQIRRGVTRSLRQRVPDAPRDLSTILAKATAVDPLHRYEGVEAFADDLRRFLADRPIRARGLSAVTRCIAWSRRNRVVATFATMATGTMVAAAFLGWVAWWTTDSALARERVATQSARDNQTRAEAASAKSEANLELSLASYEELFSALAACQLDIDEAPRSDVPSLPPMSSRDIEIMERVLAFYERFAAANADHERLRHQAMKAFRRAGDIHRWLGETEQAKANLEHAAAFHAMVPADRRDENWYAEYADLCLGLGLARSQGEGAWAGMPVLRQAQRTLEDWLADHASPRCDYELARLHNATGVALTRRAATLPGVSPSVFERAMAAESHAAAVTIAQRLVDTQNGQQRDLLLLARSLRLVAQLQAGGTLNKQSIARAEKSLRLLEDLAVRFPDEAGCRFELVEARSLVAALGSDRDEARREMELAVAEAERLASENGSVTDYLEMLARVTHRAGELALRDGNASHAVEVFAHEAELRQDLRDKFPRVASHLADQLTAWRRQAVALQRAGRAQEARVLLERASAVAQKAAATLALPFGMFLADPVDQDLVVLLREQGDEAAATALAHRISERRWTGWPDRYRRIESRR